MGGLFSKPDVPEIPKIDPQIAINNAEMKRLQEEEKATKDSEIETRKAQAKNRRMGRGSLMTGAATGVQAGQKPTDLG